MKPLLYHLEYHMQNGYFDRFPKGQAIKIVIGNDGGVQTLYGRGTGSGRVMFSSGKSVLFAMDRSKEELKVVFRAYSEDKCLGEAVKIFKGTSFPKRTEVGEPASFTFGSDLGFRKGSDLIGAIKSFIRVTSFGENIISDCIKDGESYRVRMTSLIVERNKDPRKNVKPWWVILDGRRLRFSRWLRALEKENFTKDVYLKVNKCSDEDNLPGISETFLDEEDEAALETVEAVLKKDFDSIREFGSQETLDKGSQVNFHFDPSLYALEIDTFGIKSTGGYYFEKNEMSSSSCQVDLSSFEGISTKIGDNLNNSYYDIELSSTIQPTGSWSSKESGFLAPDNVQNTERRNDPNSEFFLDMKQTTKSESGNIPEQTKTIDEKTGTSCKKMKVDEIFHFERSTSDIFGENVSIESSGGVGSLVSEVLRVSDCEVEPPVVTDKSFLAETIVREIIDIFIDRVFEREYCPLEQNPIEDLTTVIKEESCNKGVRVVGYGDTESLMDISVLGIAKTSACVDLSVSPNIRRACTSALCGDEVDKKEKNDPKTKFICSKKVLPEKVQSSEECTSSNCKGNEYMVTNGLQQESDVSCVLITCSDQNKHKDHLCYTSRERDDFCSGSNNHNEDRSNSRSHGNDVESSKWPTRCSAHLCVSEWLKEDVITPCFTCDEETRDDLIHREGWKRTIINNEPSLVDSRASGSLSGSEDESRSDVKYPSGETQPRELSSRNTIKHHPSRKETVTTRSNCCLTDKSSVNEHRESQESRNASLELKITEEFRGSAETPRMVDIGCISKNKSSTRDDNTKDSSSESDNVSEHARQK